LADGFVTGIAVTAAIWALCGVLGFTTSRTSEIVFLTGALLALLSSLWALAGYRSPPGVLALIKGTAEVYPTAERGGFWIDRFIHVHNVWLTAGVVAVLASFFIATR
jgi:hypothetical protein